MFAIVSLHADGGGGRVGAGEAWCAVFLLVLNPGSFEGLAIFGTVYGHTAAVL